MREIRTLKDLEDYESQAVYAFKKELKAEAIKWTKEFLTEVNPNIKHYFMTFFNLTEKDLEEKEK